MDPQAGNSKGKRIGRLLAIGTVLFVIGFIAWGSWPKRSGVEVKVVFSHFENVAGGQVAVFQVSNTGNKPVTMYGPGAVWPVCLFGSYDGTNWNSDYNTGMEFRVCDPIVLRPGAKIAMPTFLPSLDCWEVGVQYSTAAYARVLPSWLRRFGVVENFAKTRMRAAWSDPITLSSKPTNIVAPLGAMTNQIRVNAH